jgi:hypothetical protein
MATTHLGPRANLTPPRTRWLDIWLAGIVVLYLGVSSFALTAFGLQYGGTGGAAWEKIHPATLLAGLLVMLVAVLKRNPLTAFAAVLAARPTIVAYVCGIGLLIGHAIFVAGVPFTTFIDTFLAAAVVFLLLRDVDAHLRRNLALLVHVMVLANALLGIAEFSFGFRLTPLDIGMEVLESEWRSSALFGHPLSNALLTGSYIVLLMSGGARDLPVWIRPLAFLVAAAAMIVFGGRAATLFVLVFLAWYVARQAVSVLSGQPFNQHLVLVGLLGLPLLAGLVLMLAGAGFFERFLERFIDDQGSAATRVEMFALFRYFSWNDLLFGPDHAYLQTLMRHYGLDYGIESFWVSMILTHGILVSGLFFIVLGLFCFEVLRARPAGLSVMIYFFAVATASLSLSAKTTGFAVLIMMILLLLPGNVIDERVARPRLGRIWRPRLDVA